VFSHPHFTPYTVLLAKGIIGFWNAEEFIVKSHLIQILILFSYLKGDDSAVSYVLNRKHKKIMLKKIYKEF